MEAMGISGFLLKPVDAPTLLAKVAEALAGLGVRKAGCT